jgi:hypothetical protein
LNFGPAPVFSPAAATSLRPQPARSPPPHWASTSRPAQPAPSCFFLPQDEADRVPSPACAAPCRSLPPSASKMAGALTPHHFPPPGRSPLETTHNGAPLCHRLPTSGDPAVEVAGPSFPSPAPWPELSGTGAAGGRALVSSCVQQWPPVHGGPVAPRSTAPWTEFTNFSVQKKFQKI